MYFKKTKTSYGERERERTMILCGYSGYNAGAHKGMCRIATVART